MSEGAQSAAGKYAAVCSPLEGAHAGAFEGVSGLAGFWKRWTKCHADTLAAFFDAGKRPQDAAADAAFDAAGSALLKKRMRMVSTLAQGLKRQSAGPGAHAACQALLAAHDAAFAHLLQGELAILRAELTKAYVAKRTLGAYAQTVQYRGE